MGKMTDQNCSSLTFELDDNGAHGVITAYPHGITLDPRVEVTVSRSDDGSMVVSVDTSETTGTLRIYVDGHAVHELTVSA
jgi:hypothetical protein